MISSLVILKIAFSLFVVLLIMYIALKLVQKYSKIGNKFSKNNNGISLDSVLYLDETTKLVDISKSQNGIKKVNYLVAVNKNNIVLIDKYAIDKE